MVDKIGQILERKKVRFSSSHPLGNAPIPPDKLKVGRFLIDHFPLFDSIRGNLKQNVCPPGGDRDRRRFLDTLHQWGVLETEQSGCYHLAQDWGFVCEGDWLETLVAGAMQAARAGAVLCGQHLTWECSGIIGKSEVDVLARQDDRLIFVSCKVMKAYLRNNNQNHRNRLRAAMDEADNWVDQFGDSRRDCAVLVVTTDLVDEATGQLRYPELFGKGYALHVHLLPLDFLRWDGLVRRLRQILACPTGDD